MESGDRGKRKGFTKGKLATMSFYRPTSKHPLASSSCSKVKPSKGGNLHHHHHLLNATGQSKQRIQPPNGRVEFTVNQEKVTPSQPEQRVSIFLQETTSNLDTYANVDSFYATVAADEGVDMEAATYISSVYERFRLNQAPTHEFSLNT